MAESLFELKEKMYSLRQEILEDAKQIDAMCKNFSVPMADIETKRSHRNSLVSEYEQVKKKHDAMESKQLSGIMTAGAGMERDATLKAKAAFYRDALTGGVRKAYEGLGAIPAADPDLGGGERFLPTNLSNELITEPLTENPLRAIMRMSSITGLEEPRLSFKLEGAYDDITDKETAKEIELTGDSVTYGRHKVKVTAKVSDTVLHGTSTDLVTEIENGLRSGLAVNELSRMFAVTPGEGYEGMSFYSTENAVKTVEGATKQEAIANALADLPLTYRRNAKIVMSSVDWYNMWKDNLNTAGTFFEGRPLTLFGKPVILADEAVDPVVGDFSYARINYDISTIYDVDKDVKKGEYYFVLTAWYDIKLRLKSAFRLAKVATGAQG